MIIQQSVPDLIPAPPSGTDLRARAVAATRAEDEERRLREEQRALEEIQERVKWIKWFAERLEIPHYEIGADAHSIIADGLHFSVAVVSHHPRFHIMEPCVECHELAPHTAIDNLLDLGRSLTTPHEPELCPACSRLAAEAEEVAS